MNIEEMTLLKDFVEGKIQRDKLENYRGSYKLGFFYTKDLQKAIETLLTAYEKEKETSHYIQSQLDIANAKLVEEKEKNKKAIDFINDNNNYFEDGENWQNVLKIKEILEE